jgi:hypothetical protein
VAILLSSGCVELTDDDELRVRQHPPIVFTWVDPGMICYASPLIGSWRAPHAAKVYNIPAGHPCLYHTIYLSSTLWCSRH